MWPLSDFRKGDHRPAFLAFFTLLGTTAAHTLLETARDALFLARLPVSRLAWMILGIAACGLALSRLDRGRGPSLAPLTLAGAVTLAFWLVLGITAHPIVVYALYLWTGVAASWTLIRFWLALGARFTISEGKRLFGFIGIGSVLGALLGAGFARALALVIDARGLVLAAGLVFLTTALGPAAQLARCENARSPLPPKGRDDDAEPARTLLRKDRYSRRILALVLSGTVVLTIADYLFKAAAQAHLRSDQLVAFFSTTSFVMSALALLVQVVGSGWLLRVIGVHRALLVLPVLMVAGVSGFVATGTLTAALLMKGSDAALRHSLHRTSIELLFLPISDKARERVKPVIDLFGQRGGQALASVAILSFGAFEAHRVILGSLVLLVSMIWIGVTLTVRRHYLDVFRATLRVGQERPALRETPASEIPEVAPTAMNLGTPIPEVATATGRMGHHEFHPTLLRLLSGPTALPAAAEALAALGPPALESLVVSAKDPSIPREIRWNIPDVISGFEPNAASFALVDLLLDAPEGIVRDRSLRGLRHLRFEDPALPISEVGLSLAADRAARAAFTNLEARVVLERGAKDDPSRRGNAHDLLLTLLRDRETVAIGRLFHILDLLHSQENFHRVHRALKSESPRARASARELCEHVVAPSLRGALLVLIDDLPDEARLDRAVPHYLPSRLDYAAQLRTLARRSEELSSLVSRHTDEIGLCLAPAPESVPLREGDATNVRDALVARLAAEAPVLDLVLMGVDLRGVDFANAVLTGVDLTGADLRGCRLPGAKLAQANLRGARLAGADLKGADLEGANLEGASLEGAIFEGALVAQANFQGASGKRAVFSRCKGERTVLLGGTWRGADFGYAELRHADMRAADFGAARLDGADFDGSDLTAVNLTGATRRGAKLPRG